MKTLRTFFYLLLFFLLAGILNPGQLLAQRSKDGAKIVATANNVVNEYTTLSANAAAGATTITVASIAALNANGRFPGALAPGDLIMIIQVQGATILGAPDLYTPAIGYPYDSTWGGITNYNNCGNWEFAEVYSISGSTITFDCPLKYNYDVSGRVEIVRVPRYSSLTINNGGSITCDPWSAAYTGGVCAIEVENNTIINAGGSIDGTGKGFRGAQLLENLSQFLNLVFSASTLGQDGAEKGEGIAGYETDYTQYGGMYARGAPANGGGGGNVHNCGGGGGGNGGNPASWSGHGMPDLTGAGWTNAWNLQYAGLAAQTSTGGGQGGYSFSNSNQNATLTGPNNAAWTGTNRTPTGGYGGRPLDYSAGRLFLGGGGGSGDQNDGVGGKGGNGGALIYLMNYGTVSSAGQINSNGNVGASTTGVGTDGAGGAGAGGTIIVNSVGAISGVSITANGGKGGNQVKSNPLSNEAEGPGGGGGGGYIAVSNGAPVRTASGGANGTTNSNALSEFTPNGATKGDSGTTHGVVTNFIINAPNVTICAGQSATLTGTLTGTVPGGTTIIWYNAIIAGTVIGTGNTYTTTVLPVGTYTYYVGTCPGTYHQPVIVTVSSSPLVSAGPDATICSAGSTTLNASGGTGYVWSPATNLSNPNISNPVANPASTTTYVVTVTTPCGNGNDTVVVTVNSSITATISGTTTICAGAPTTLTASGGGNYSWSTGATTTSITVSPTGTTNYSVTVSNGNCTSTAGVTVTASSGITATINGPAAVCTGSSATLTASGGTNYSWSTGATTTSITISPTGTTNYSVTVSSGNCSGTASLTVTASSGITATINGPAAVCTGSSATLTASGGTNYSWSTGATTTSITVTPTANTTYTVTVSNGNCSGTATHTVNVSGSLTAAIAGNTTICGGGTTTLTASGGTAFSWSTGATTASISVSASGAYSVTVSSGNCSSSASVNVVVSPSITVTGISSSAVQCGAANGSATANVQGGTGALTYNWNPTGQTTSTATGLNAGGNYTVTISDAIGCSLTTTVNVVALNAPFVTVAGNTSLCIGDAATLTASGGNTYSWSTGSTATTITITPGVTTNYTVTATIGNCVDTATFAVSVLPPPIANIASNTTICAGQSATLTASGGGLYAWNNGATTSAITISPSTNTAYSVTVSIGSCSTTANASVNVVPVPTPTITATNTLICGGDRTTLTASGGTTYSWSNGMTSSSIAVTPSATTTYAVTSGNGVCTDTATVKITVLPPPIATVSGNNNLCQGNAATLTASGGGTYSWSSGQTTAVINPSTAGSYSVVVTIGTCRDTATSTVTVNPNPAATVSPDVIIIQGQSTTLTASGGTNYVWDNGMNGNPITVSPLSTTNYCVTVYDANNCKDTACVTVIVERCSDAGTLYLPNAFSPNGDGANDSLQIFYGIPQCVKSFHLVIYNRWGEKVYETGDPAFKWDGIYDKGLLLGTGEANTEVFTYYMNVEILDGSKVARKGNISLVR